MKTKLITLALVVLVLALSSCNSTPTSAQAAIDQLVVDLTNQIGLTQTTAMRQAQQKRLATLTP